VPPSDKAFFLDENLGVEHLYLVATHSPWPELETNLSKATQARPMGKPVLTHLEIKPRGVAGTESVKIGSALPGIVNGTANLHVLKSIEGALVMDFWFNHIAAKKEH
jgi:hypothetical protein